MRRRHAFRRASLLLLAPPVSMEFLGIRRQVDLQAKGAPNDNFLAPQLSLACRLLCRLLSIYSSHLLELAAATATAATAFSFPPSKRPNPIPLDSLLCPPALALCGYLAAATTANSNGCNHVKCSAPIIHSLSRSLRYARQPSLGCAPLANLRAIPKFR